LTQAVDSPPRVFTAAEEAANFVTHLLGLVLAVVGAVFLILAVSERGDAWHVAGCAAYAVTLVGAYAASTLSHAFPRRPRIEHAFRVADQAVIFLFIFGTWVPIATAWLRTPGWWPFHGGMFGVAMGGFLSKTVFTHRVTVGAVTTRLYLLLGWLPVAAAPWAVPQMPTALALWVAAGGVCYTLGLVFFLLDTRKPFFHSVWHLLVVAGSACHYAGIYRYCTG
jgi:hemolysin III